MKRLGFIVNPVAGIGGKVGLKGSDGADILKKALELGAVRESGQKALVAMKILKEAETEFKIYTWPREMGEDVCREAGLEAEVLGSITSGATTPEDTIRAAKEMRALGLDLILFVGGDGTARNIMDAVGTDAAALGIPAGCKIHSGVYALNPKTAGKLLVEYAQGKVKETKLAEVMDIDESQFRNGVVQARLYGYLKIPNESRMIQNLKSGRGFSESVSIEMLSNYVADEMEDGTLYIVGTGSTTASIMQKLGLPNTLLGVDVVYNRKVVASDCTERELLELIDRYSKVKIIVTVIGGQGYVFGRGNQQISAEVIQRVGKDNIIIAASRNKILSLFGSTLHVDTGNEEVNQMLCGYYRVIVGYEDIMMLPMRDV